MVIWTERFTVDSLHALHAKVYQLIHQHRHEWDKTRLLEVRHITSPLPFAVGNHNTHSPKRFWLAVGLQELIRAVQEHPPHSQSLATSDGSLDVSHE